jgi:mono/diheme cytochrome c family protein
MQVEIGNYMQNFGPDRKVKNKWVLQGMKQLGVEVLNVTESDIDELKAQGVDFQQDDQFISANLISSGTNSPLVKPYRVKQITLPGAQKEFRLGFLGLSSQEGNYKTDEKGYLWADPLLSAKQWIPELRKQCDFLIVLACMPSKDAIQLAVDNPDVDVILNGFKHQWSDPPSKINQSTIVYAEDEGRILGELRLRIAGKEKAEVNPVNHLLTKVVKDDPEMAAFVGRAKEEITAQQRSLANEKPPLAASFVLRVNSPYLTSKPCESCHATAYEVWQHSKHAKAIDILKQVKREFDSSCVGCHTTGKGKTGGFEDLNQTPELANVQCEACHGPGRAHSAKPAEFKMARLNSSDCLQCHTRSNSPEFGFANYWPKIKH